MKFDINELAVGSWDKLPHYSVIGEPTNFYVWINIDGRGSSSDWIKGTIAFSTWYKLAKLCKKDKLAFIRLVAELHTNHPK